jgi:hypothetical protein
MIARAVATLILFTVTPIVWAMEQWDRRVMEHDWREDW